MPTIKPEFFNYDMTRAILEGRKTATRRLVKQKGYKIQGLFSSAPLKEYGYVFSALNLRTEKEERITLYPRHLPGDIIYVRENFSFASKLSDICDNDGPIYMSDFSPSDLAELKDKNFKWKPSIHMPKECARLFLCVKTVSAERLRDITEEGAASEGISAYDLGNLVTGYASSLFSNVFYDTATDAFASLWNSMIEPTSYPVYGWLANPMVWAYEFEVISREEALGERDDA